MLKTKRISLFLCCVLGCFSLWAQQVTLEGVIKDTAKNPLQNTNIIATSLEGTQQTTFAITDQKGRYRLKLAKGITYHIEITHIGYAKLNDTLQLQTHKTKSYKLQAGVVNMEPVVIQSQMAVVVKEDTIIYNTNRFKTGAERKLRDILEKLPGVEVSEEGRVTVNGKTVSRLLVDGKPFFSGDVQLGVNNIPSDAVDQVVAIDDYHQVAFMKGLSHSNVMAMNIKLKKGEKHFVFGESQAGGGIENRYNIRPALFYYSPKSTVNFIGSFNNVGESPLGFKDLMRFKGGYMNLNNDPIYSGNIGLNRFSDNTDVLFQKTIFGAFNFTRQIAPKLRLSAYTIAALQKNRSHSNSNITYLVQDKLNEFRARKTQQQDFGSYSKIKLRYQPDSKTDMAYHLLVNASDNEYYKDIKSLLGDRLHAAWATNNPHEVVVKNYFRYNSRPTYKHTSVWKANYIYKRNRSLSNWFFDQPVFGEIIPAVSSGDTYNFLHHYQKTTHKFALKYKHYWVLNNTNHLYPVAGVYYAHQSYESRDYQRLDDGTMNSFKKAGFDNDVNFQMIDPYIGLKYKFKLGKFIFRPGVIYHHYLWKANQFETSIIDAQKGGVLPELYTKYKLSNGEKIELNYNLNSVFQEITSYANRYRLTSFNRLFKGNKNLENSLAHYVNLNYRQFSTYRDISFYTNLYYRHVLKSSQYVTQLEGIDQVGHLIYSDFPENSYGFSGNFQKRWDQWSVSFGGQLRFYDYSRLINENIERYDSQYYRYNLAVETDFKKLPNIEVGVSQSFSLSKSDAFKNQFTAINPYLHFDYNFLDGFILKLDYAYTWYKNKKRRMKNKFQIFNAVLYYDFKNSPWGIEIRAKNIFDIKYKNRNSFNEFRVYDYRTYIQARTLLLVLSFQL